MLQYLHEHNTYFSHNAIAQRRPFAILTTKPEQIYRERDGMEKPKHPKGNTPAEIRHRTPTSLYSSPEATPQCERIRTERNETLLQGWSLEPGYAAACSVNTSRIAVSA